MQHLAPQSEFGTGSGMGFDDAEGNNSGSGNDSELGEKAGIDE